MADCIDYNSVTIIPEFIHFSSDYHIIIMGVFHVAVTIFHRYTGGHYFAMGNI